MKPTGGYSGTALAKKLGIQEGSRVFVVDAPKDYAKLVAPLPKGVKLVNRIDEETHMVHIFAKARDRLDSALKVALARIPLPERSGCPGRRKPRRSRPTSPRTPSGSSRCR